MTIQPGLAEWIAGEAISFALQTPTSLDAATDRLMAGLGPGVRLLALGEALHGSEEILLIRNRMFQRLAEQHGFSAVVLETSSPQARAANEYVLGERGRSDAGVEGWLASGFGLAEANRELVDWMRGYNTGTAGARATTLRLYGFDLPLGQGGLASPGGVLDIALRYLERVDAARAAPHRQRITALVGDPAEWERPAAMFDPAQAIGLEPRARDLRIACLDLITELRIRRPAYTLRTDPLGYADALHHAELGRKLLDAHAALATPGAYTTMLGIRDLIMADNVLHVLDLERTRGKVLVFAASGHLKRSTVQWRLPPGDDVKEWWPAGSHLTQAVGAGYAVIGMALGASEPNGVALAEPGTIEAALGDAGGCLLLPTHRGRGLPAPEIERAPVRSGSALNPTYAPLTLDSFSDFDWLVFVDATTYPRGLPPLTAWSAG